MALLEVNNLKKIYTTRFGGMPAAATITATAMPTMAALSFIYASTQFIIESASAPIRHIQSILWLFL